MSLPRPKSVFSALPAQTELAHSLAKLENWSRHWRWRYGWTIRPLTLAVAIRLLVFAAGVAGVRMDTHAFSSVLTIWLQKDANWYVNIASKGYYVQNGIPLTANFFPLYPLSISILQRVTGLFMKTDSYLLAGMLVSWAAFLGACVVLFRLVADRFGDRTAYLSVLLLGIFPFSFFFGAPYAESLYLLCVVVAFLGIERGNWWLHFGDPLAYSKAAAIGWHGHFQIGAVLEVGHFLRHPQMWLQTQGNFITFIYVFLVVVFLALSYPIYRLLGASYLVFSVLSCIAPLIEFSEIKSTGRYLSVIFPR